MEEIMVSIICTTYNHEKYIAQAIESFLMQKTNFDYEIIIHDDASTDSTADIIEKYAKEYPHIIKPIYQKENQYSKKARIVDTYMIPVARGKYFALCEGDDYWTSENKLQKQIDYMEEHPKCTFCIHNAIKVNEASKKVGYVRTVNASRVISCEEVIWGDGGFCATNSIVAPMSLRRNMPEFFDILSIDYIQQMYYASLGESYCFKEEMSAYRTEVPGSWTVNMKKNYLAHVEIKRKIIKVLGLFDSYTNYQYHEMIAKRRKKFELEICELERNFSRLKDSEFRGWLRELTVKGKISFGMKMICPTIYYYIIKIKGKL